MTHKIAKIWNRVSYETMIFIAFLIRFLSTRALDLDTWSSAWDAMDYSMGNGSRLLIGSIYKLFYGDYLDVTVAYKYVGIGIMLTILVLAIVLADMAAGIFKHSGPLKGLWADFPPRWRPMFTPSLEGLEITPDSLRALRRAAMPHDWAVHVPPEAVSGMYGTVSAHAATIVALAVLSCGAIRRKWFTALMVVCTLVICYSRIYLGKHFPMDIVWGTLVGLGLGYAALRGYLRLAQSRNRRFTHPG